MSFPKSFLGKLLMSKKNPIARKVKLADLRNNTDLRRTDGKKPRKYDIYLEAIKILEE